MSRPRRRPPSGAWQGVCKRGGSPAGRSVGLGALSQDLWPCGMTLASGRGARGGCSRPRPHPTPPPQHTTPPPTYPPTHPGAACSALCCRARKRGESEEPEDEGDEEERRGEGRDWRDRGRRDESEEEGALESGECRGKGGSSRLFIRLAEGEGWLVGARNCAQSAGLGGAGGSTSVGARVVLASPPILAASRPCPSCTCVPHSCRSLRALSTLSSVLSTLLPCPHRG